jgi:1-aminocyclopropane-1-carboxylate deaminase
MYKKPLIQTLSGSLFETNGIKADTLRLDLIHTHVSGNKWYKLKYHIAEALAAGKKGLLSYGGAWSNHLVAMAFASNEMGLRSAAVIRGEEPQVYGPALQQMKDLGMELVFVSRAEYKDKIVLPGYEDYQIVPEGGSGELGIKGASEILKEVQGDYSHIICAVGTGTTMAGIINSAHRYQHVVGISALKVADTTDNELLQYIGAHTTKNNYSIQFGYHFGGYAKRTDELIAFMNSLYAEEKIPTDFVYTGKLFYAVYDLLSAGYFPHNSHLLVMHSGGLQGNRSLPSGTLDYQ